MASGYIKRCMGMVLGEGGGGLETIAMRQGADITMLTVRIRREDSR